MFNLRNLAIIGGLVVAGTVAAYHYLRTVEVVGGSEAEQDAENIIETDEEITAADAQRSEDAEPEVGVDGSEESEAAGEEVKFN